MNDGKQDARRTEVFTPHWSHFSVRVSKGQTYVDWIEGYKLMRIKNATCDSLFMGTTRGEAMLWMFWALLMSVKQNYHKSTSTD